MGEGGFFRAGSMLLCKGGAVFQRRIYATGREGAGSKVTVCVNVAEENSDCI